MKVSVMVMTDGRKECLLKTLRSMVKKLHGPISEVVIINDSGDSEYADWLLQTFPMYQHVQNPKRLGFGEAIQSGWDYLNSTSQPNWIFHLEDDFTFNVRVPILSLISILAGNPHLMQIALRRQPVNDIERIAGGVIEQWPLEYQEFNTPYGSWLEHRLFFTTNPCLYKRSLTDVGWPQGPQSERAFTNKLLQRGVVGVEPKQVKFGFYGCRSDRPIVEHIGTQRVGTGY